MKIKLILLLFTFLFVYSCYGQKKKANSFLYRIQNQDEDCGYMNAKGDTVIPIGKYLMCLDDTIKEIGFVLSNEKGFICINNKDSFLFQVFNFDNGPDYPSEGLFRIVKDGKIGYADLHGKVVIKPRFKCAWPFENGMAKVSYNCDVVKKGEYDFWEGGEWFYVDKKGKRKSGPRSANDIRN